MLYLHRIHKYIGEFYSANPPALAWPPRPCSLWRGLPTRPLPPTEVSISHILARSPSATNSRISMGRTTGRNIRGPEPCPPAFVPYLTATQRERVHSSGDAPLPRQKKGRPPLPAADPLNRQIARVHPLGQARPAADRCVGGDRSTGRKDRIEQSLPITALPGHPRAPLFNCVTECSKMSGVLRPTRPRPVFFWTPPRALW